MKALSLEDLLYEHDLSEATIPRFLEILSGGVAANKYLNALTDKEKEQLKSVINKWLDIWFDRHIDFQRLHCRLCGTDEKEATYDYNHRNIMKYVRSYVAHNRSMPTVKTIADALKLNRKTVSKHLEQQGSRDELAQDFSLMTRDIMGTIAGVALADSDVRAAKAYMDIAIKMTKNRAAPTHVTIDNISLTQPMVDRLTPAQKAIIMDVIYGDEAIEEADIQLAVEVKEVAPAPEEKKDDDTVYKNPKEPTLFG